MHQIKIFKGIETEVAALEAEVNNWLAESGVEVVQIVGNIAPQSNSPTKSTGLTKSVFAPSDIMLVVVFKKP